MESHHGERRRWRRVQDLFHRARELSADERELLLARHCGDDASLRAEVEELLADALPPSESVDAAELGRERENLEGSVLGQYRLGRIVGEGSMGVIYEARQRYIERSVALKILRRRRDVLAEGGSAEAYERMTQRFAAEAEVLGLLDHPGIVPIHEMGHEGGRRFFTMRLVRGDDLRDVIARVHEDAGSEWTLERALGVVVRVCETMAFAHDRGVLHRDLKPSHVMVGDFGEVYLVDWGLAKLPGRRDERDIRIREEAAERVDAQATRAPTPLRTIDGDAIGTPAYMPPEQARGELAKMGPRADVYAVGAILYHLVVGRPPYVGEGEHPSAQAVLERVRREEPESVGAAAPGVPAALAAIVRQAMARDVASRYPTIDALADDLRAYLENRVVRAHRTGALTQGWKWVQRNRWIAVGGVAFLMVLVAWGASLVRLELAKAHELAVSAEEAQRERDRAREQAAVATATTDFLDDLFRAVHPLEARGDVVTVREALDEAARRLPDAFPDQPLVEASVRRMLGVAYHRLGLYADAESHLAGALERRRAVLGEDAPDTVASMGDYGVLLGDLGRFARAEALLRDALERTARRSGPGAPETLHLRGRLAQVLFGRERFGEAEEEAEGLLDAHDTAPEDRLVALEVMGSIRARENRFEEAEGYFARQLDLNREAFGEDHPNTWVATGNLVTALDALGRNEEARTLSLDLVERMDAVFGPRHRNTLFAMANAGVLLSNQGAWDEAAELLSETLELQREVFGAEHPETLLATYNLAEVLRRGRRFTEAEPLYDELLRVQVPRLDDDHADLRRVLHGLADCLVAREAYDEAVALLEELHGLQLRNTGAPLASTADAADTAWQLRFCYEALGREEEARALEREHGPIERTSSR